MANRKLKVRHKKKRPAKKRINKIKKPSIKKIKMKKRMLKKAVKSKSVLKPELKSSKKKVGFFGRLFGAKPKEEAISLKPLIIERLKMKVKRKELPKKKESERLVKRKEELIKKKRAAALKSKEMFRKKREALFKRKRELIVKKKEMLKKKEILRKKAAEEKKRLLEKKKEEYLRKKREIIKKRREMLKRERRLILKRKKELLLKRREEDMLKRERMEREKKEKLKKLKIERLKKLKKKKIKKTKKVLKSKVKIKHPQKKVGFLGRIFGAKPKEELPETKPFIVEKPEIKIKEVKPKIKTKKIEKAKREIKPFKIPKLKKKRPEKIAKPLKPAIKSKSADFLGKLFGAEKEKPPEFKPLETPNIKEIVPEKPEVLTEKKIHIPEVKMGLKKERKPAKPQKIRGEERPHLKLNIPGFDSLFKEGIPAGNSVLVEGGPGVGKTIFCLQTAYNLCKQGKKVLYMSFEEPEERLKNHMRNFGWDVDELERKGLIRIKRFDALDVARSVEALLSEAKKELLIEVHPMMFPRDFEPDVVCVDSLTSIASAFTGEESRFRIYMEQLFRYLERTNMTSFLIRECSNPAHIGQIYVEKFEAISFLSDGIIIMYNVIYENGQRGSALEVLKMRGEKIDRRLVKLEITNKGLVVYPKSELTDRHHIKYSLT